MSYIPTPELFWVEISSRFCSPYSVVFCEYHDVYETDTIIRISGLKTRLVIWHYTIVLPTCVLRHHNWCVRPQGWVHFWVLLVCNFKGTNKAFLVKLCNIRCQPYIFGPQEGPEISLEDPQICPIWAVKDRVLLRCMLVLEITSFSQKSHNLYNTCAYVKFLWDKYYMFRP